MRSAAAPLVEPLLMPGDLVFTTDTDSRLSKLIRWATRTRKEEASEASHAAMVVVGAPLHHATVIEAVQTIRRVQIGEVYPETAVFEVWRPTNVPGADLDAIVQHAYADLGKHYPYAQLVLHLLDRLIPRNPRLFRRFAGLSGSLTCWASIAKWYSAAGYAFGSPSAEAMSPDDGHDYCKSHPHQYRLIRPWAPLQAPRHR